MVSGLIGAVTGATVSASLLSALGYLALIGGAAYAGYKGATWVVDKLQTYTGMGTDPNAPTDMSGQTLLNRLPQKIKADLTNQSAPWEDPLNPNSPAHFAMLDDIKSNAAQGQTITGGTGVMSAAPESERDRRMFLLGWWDALWG
jgi:hypothetical protein